MNKRQIYHYLGMLSKVKTWQLVIAAVLLSGATIVLLRSNSIQAVRLFEAVKQTDKEDGNTNKALKDLQRYVSGHMNTQLDRVSLEETYARDYKAALEKLSSSGGVNDANYRDAEMTCQAELARTGSFPGYAQCVSARVGQTAPGQNPELAANLPNPARYQYTFVSPAWSSDFAGIMLALTGVAWLLIGCKTILQLIMRSLLRHRAHG